MSKFQVSQSKAKTWRKCRKAYYYKYVMRLRRLKVARPLMFGRIVHEMTEAHAAGDDPFKILSTALKEQGKLFAAEREMYGDILEDIRIIMQEYFSYWDSVKTPMSPIRVNKSNAEHDFAVDLTPDIELIGKIDAFGRAGKMTWLVERKTFNQRPNDDHRWRNIQSALYCWAVEKLGWLKLDGICWDYIWSKPPQRPEMLKDGTLSQKKIRTLPSAVIDTVKRRFPKMKPTEYAALIKQGERDRREYFFRVFNPIDGNVIDMVVDDFVSTANEMKDFPQRPSGYVRNIDRHCDWCEFEGICRAELLNLDVDDVIEREYETREKPEEQPVVED